MDKYEVRLMPRASRDIEGIYNHIADEFKDVETAEKMADSEEIKTVIIVTVRYTPSSF